MGDQPKVDEPAQVTLQTLVEQTPRDLGLPYSVWNCLELAKSLGRRGHALVSDETVRRHLHQLDYRIIRPVLSIASPDPEFKRKVAHLAACQELARQGQLILLYEDEVDLNLLPGIVGCWTRRGQQRKVPTPGQNVKRYGFGALNFMSGQLTTVIKERKNSDSFCQLLEQIVTSYCPDDNYTGPKIGLVLDNYIIHRSKKSQKLLAKYADRLFLIPLPTYAPKLNLIELLWKHLRRQVTHNHLFETITDLVEAVEQFFCRLNANRSEVLSVIGSSA